MTPLEQKRFDRIRRENDELFEENARLRAALTSTGAIPAEWKLTGSERTVFGVLVNRPLATKVAIMTALYGADVEDEPNEAIISVHICRIKKKSGVRIQNTHGLGYALDPATRRAFRSQQREAA